MRYSLTSLINEAGRLNRETQKRRVSRDELLRTERYLENGVRSGDVDFSEKQKELNFINKAILNSQLVRELKDAR